MLPGKARVGGELLLIKPGVADLRFDQRFPPAPADPEHDQPVRPVRFFLSPVREGDFGVRCETREFPDTLVDGTQHRLAEFAHMHKAGKKN